MKTGLVLAGGGFRGIYTAGVIDTFMEHYSENIRRVYNIGISDAKKHIEALKAWLNK